MSVKSSNELGGCPPVLCDLQKCILKMLLIGNTGESRICKKNEAIKFNFGLSSTKKRIKKLGSCTTVEEREIELVFHVTAKQCSPTEECRTLELQRTIEERFCENPCFCHISSGPASLVESDIIRTDKSSRTLTRQLVFAIPYKIHYTSPQKLVKVCNHVL